MQMQSRGEERVPSQIFYEEALAALSNHLRVVEQRSSHHHQKAACQDYAAQEIHAVFLLLCVCVRESFDCIKPIVVFCVPVVLRV